jgi:hypothetical protein
MTLTEDMNISMSSVGVRVPALKVHGITGSTQLDLVLINQNLGPGIPHEPLNPPLVFPLDDLPIS